TRQEAIDRMRRALREYQIEGIKTNIAFFIEVLNDAEFRNGEFDTGFIDRWLSTHKQDSSIPNFDRDIAALAVALFHSEGGQPRKNLLEDSRHVQSPWKLDGRRRGLRTS